jgi:hypothetical protein
MYAQKKKRFQRQTRSMPPGQWHSFEEAHQDTETRFERDADFWGDKQAGRFAFQASDAAAAHGAKLASGERDRYRPPAVADLWEQFGYVWVTVRLRWFWCWFGADFVLFASICFSWLVTDFVGMPFFS